MVVEESILASLLPSQPSRRWLGRRGQRGTRADLRVNLMPLVALERLKRVLPTKTQPLSSISHPYPLSGCGLMPDPTEKAGIVGPLIALSEQLTPAKVECRLSFLSLPPPPLPGSTLLWIIFRFLKCQSSGLKMGTPPFIVSHLVYFQGCWTYCGRPLISQGKVAGEPHAFDAIREVFLGVPDGQPHALWTQWFSSTRLQALNLTWLLV